MVLQESVDDFTILMKAKLLLNMHKGGYERLHASDLIKLMKAEIKELEKSLDDMDYKNSAMECADVANYAYMLADKILKRKLI